MNFPYVNPQIQSYFREPMDKPLNTFGKGEMAKIDTEFCDDTGTFANKTDAALDEFLDAYPELGIDRGGRPPETEDE
jgi:hypothetical protein